MKRFAVIFILTALLALSVSAHVLPPASTWRTRSTVPVDDARFQCDLGVKYPAFQLTLSDRISLRTLRRYPQKVHVPGIGARWVICQNNPVMYTDPTGMLTWKGVKNTLYEMAAMPMDAVLHVTYAVNNLVSDTEIHLEDAVFYSSYSKSSRDQLVAGESALKLTAKNTSLALVNAGTLGGASYVSLWGQWNRGEITIDQLDDALSGIATGQTLAAAGASVRSARAGTGWRGGIKTPYGTASQSTKPGALAVRNQVKEGAPLYRIGTLGKSHAGEAQFWSLEHPSTPGFAQRYGVPLSNIKNANFIEAGTLRPGSSFVTRPAPAVGMNMGGGLEVVVPKGAIQMNWFSAY